MTAAEWSDKEVIDYCEAHSRTPRASFSKYHTLRILRLAGDEEQALKVEASGQVFFDIHEDLMNPLVDAARKRLQQQVPA